MLATQTPPSNVVHGTNSVTLNEAVYYEVNYGWIDNVTSGAFADQKG